MGKYDTSLLIVGIMISFISCGKKVNRFSSHYDTTLVDTIEAINLDSAQMKDGKVITDWIYDLDSLSMTLVSQPQKKSVITPTNHLTIRVRYNGRALKDLCLIMSDGERFSGNSDDTTNVVHLYVGRNELEKFSYKPGVSKQTDTAFIQSPSSFIECLHQHTSFKVATKTFTSGTLVYEFNALSKLKER